MIHFVYITTNLINGKQYVGDHSTNDLNDGYLGSGRPYLQRALRQYGKQNFKKEILEVFPSKKEAFNAQEKYIQKYNTLFPNGYNLSPTGGLGVRGCFSHSELSKARISQSSKGISRNKNRKMSDETKQKISISKKGKTAWNKGIPMNEKTYANYISKNRGWHHSEESRQKISKNNARNKPWLNKKMSEETRKKMSASRLGVKRGKYKKSLCKSS